ncbi:aspartate carbamoyltransferase catalytic subunit [Coxiella endosymbiont of Amblyomma americanum]|uniref:aspartate carbamoyltransferase catalytic subunit n=1 Tax=Coxiella endosymbiont of Amblyomma americanum TaxID=325775 RepID=UPI0005803FA7|nr:aspartate carbamoyltransferase catalytic subunit [Coxiella endosymbiont of Amblyomma americanum]AJC50679.1 aspartate carbamoyltransferase catalytic subunit [Coxiella endosymbiont of Amblyomma americanum]AUJ59003.1 aspartate carbamoyltransferase [Coxiella-like endosymbiont of Amblyomma americanum]
MNKKDFHHLLYMQSLTRSHIDQILQRANDLLIDIKNNKIFNTLNGQVVAHLFFEFSTRTRNSFEIAAKRLGAIVLTPDLTVSSLNKGESVLDMVKNLQAMGVRFFIIRHTAKKLLRVLAEQLDHSVVINAGDGTHQHPTQGIIDLMTIQQYKSDWKKLCVTIIGDIYHSRVANSLIDGLLIMGVSEIRLAGPLQLLPKKITSPQIKKFSMIEESLINSDVIVTLRFQKERHNKPMELHTFYRLYSLTSERLALAKTNAIVMHPSPINRGVEITSEVANSQQSVILQQVKNGVAVRMAILEFYYASKFLQNRLCF